MRQSNKIFLQITQILQNGPNLNADCFKTTKITSLKFLYVIRRITDFFPLLKNNGSRDPQGQIWCQSKGQKVIALKHAYFRNFLTEMESLGNFLQNNTKFVQIPQVVAKIFRFEIWQVPLFLQKPQFLKGHISKTTAPISIKLIILAFLHKIYKQTKFHANRRFLVKKFLVI